MVLLDCYSMFTCANKVGYFIFKQERLSVLLHTTGPQRARYFDCFTSLRQCGCECVPVLVCIDIR